VAAEKLAEGLNAAVAGRHIRELREIEAARSRMSEGGYGECERCGADIALERLRAFPAARRCVACQSQHEKTHAAEFDAAV
jgi:RNA polymerase-binding transcription factor DksA